MKKILLVVFLFAGWGCDSNISSEETYENWKAEQEYKDWLTWLKNQPAETIYDYPPSAVDPYFDCKRHAMYEGQDKCFCPLCVK